MGRVVNLRRVGNPPPGQVAEAAFAHPAPTPACARWSCPTAARCSWLRKVALHAGNGANLNFASQRSLDALVRSACRGAQAGGPAIARAGYRRRTGRDYMRGIRTQLRRAPVLNWDGRVTGCRRDFRGGFGGNAFTDGLEAVLNGERIARARDMLMGRAPGRGDLPCDACDPYHTLPRDRAWLAEEEVAEAMRAPPT